MYSKAAVCKCGISSCSYSYTYFRRSNVIVQNTCPPQVNKMTIKALVKINPVQRLIVIVGGKMPDEQNAILCYTGI